MVVQNATETFAVCNREARTDRRTPEGLCERQEGPLVIYGVDV